MAEVRKGREGSRWFNDRPTGEEFAEWFKTVKLHDGLDHEDFIAGITLIQQKEKVNEVVGFDENGVPQIAEVQHIVHVPYAKVDTRVAYFWTYLALHPDWLGLIEPVTYPGQLANNYHLPPGFFGHVQTKGEARTAYVGCSMRVRIFERDTVEWRDIIETGADGKPWKRRIAEGKLVFEGAPGTKIAATTTRYDADHFSMMKAETGAVGRALGMAGMLVIPGSGVATAEDMQEAQQPVGASGPAGADAAQLPTGVADQQNDPAWLRTRIGSLLTTLQQEHPDALAAFQTWARERGFTTIDTLTEPQLKGVVKRLEKTLDSAQQENAAGAPALAGTAD